MDCSIFETEAICRRTRRALTIRRKSMIKTFQKIGYSQPGSKYWCCKLYEHMNSIDCQIEITDVERWVEKHRWITDDCVSAVRMDPNQTNPSQQQFVIQPLPPELQSVSTMTMHSVDLSEKNSPTECNSSHNPVHKDENFRGRPDLPLTPASIVSSVSQANTPTESPSNHAESRISTPASRTIESPMLSNEPGNFPIMNQEQLKKEYFSSAFNAISVLHEICSQMPEVRVCLRDLKNIHRCFVRTHEKFIFPEEYSTLRGNEQLTRVQMARIKVDPGSMNQDEVTYFEDDAVDV